MMPSFVRNISDAVERTQTIVYRKRNFLRAPEKSEIPPKSGDVIATKAMLTEIALPHQTSPNPASLPTIYEV